MHRRRFLKTLGLAGASAIAAGGLGTEARGAGGASQEKDREQDPAAVLVDTTRCVGCRTCEEACAEAHGLPVPDTSEDPPPARNTTETEWTITNRYDGEDGAVFVKRQCMHCVEPACAAACLTRAMMKTEKGPVIWREAKCMGCRFCMVSCPFDMPKFEYHSAVPRIQKCSLCWERLREGEVPACVEECPAEALLFGKRSELIAEARRRIQESPGDYVDHIYGEHEAGGTSWLYLAAVPFEKLGFRGDLGTMSYPELTTGFLFSVPVILTLWPAFLLGLSRAKESEPAEEAAASVEEEAMESGGGR